MSSENRHIQEERNQVDLQENDETGLYRDEEMKYSGVVRANDNANPKLNKKNKDTKNEF